MHKDWKLVSRTGQIEAGRRTLLVAVLLSSIIGGNSGFGACPESFRTLGRLLKNTAAGSVKGGVHAFKGLYYAPVVFPANLVWNAPKVFWGKNPLEFMWRDRYHILANAMLIGLQRTTGMTYNQMQEASEKFEEQSEDDDSLWVVIDGFSPKDPWYRGAGRYIYDILKGRHRNMVFIGPEFTESPRKFENEVRRLVAEHGKHISRFDYYGHGLPGDILSLTFGEYRNLDVAHEKNLAFSGVRHTKLDDLFLPGAAMRFNSCLAFNGNNREELGNRIAHNSLHENGGTIYGSKVQVLPNLVEMAALLTKSPEPPRWLRKYGDLLSAHNGLLTLFTSIEAGSFRRGSKIPLHWTTSVVIPIPARTDAQKLHRIQWNLHYQTRMNQIWQEAMANREPQIIQPDRRMNVLSNFALNLDRKAVVYQINLLHYDIRTTPSNVEIIEKRVRDKFPDVKATVSPARDRIVLEHIKPTEEERARFIEQIKQSWEEPIQKMKDMGITVENTLRAATELGYLSEIDRGEIQAINTNMAADLDELIKKLFVNAPQMLSTASPNLHNRIRLANANIERYIADMVLHRLKERDINFWVGAGGIKIYREGREAERQRLKEFYLSQFPKSQLLEGEGSFFDMKIILTPETKQAALKEIDREYTGARKDIDHILEEERAVLLQLRDRGLVTDREMEKAIERLNEERDEGLSGYYWKWVSEE